VPYRFVIFGNSGSGKSTLAKQIAQEHACAHLDLDLLAWNATTPPTRRELTRSLSDIDSYIQSHNNWVVEGCYTDLLSHTSRYADTLIFLDLSVNDCQENARQRPFEPHKYGSKEEQDKNLDMLLAWIADYETRDDEFSRVAHEQLYDSFPHIKHRFTDRLTEDDFKRLSLLSDPTE